MDLTRKIDFGKIAYEGKKKTNAVVLEINLRNADTDKPTFSVCGAVWNSRHKDWVAGGQCLDTIAPYFKDDRLYNLILDLWNKYHLNDMNAGTPEQTKCLKDHESEKNTIRDELRNAAWKKVQIEFGFTDRMYEDWKNSHTSEWDNYTVDCEILKRNGLYEVDLDGKPYKYGHGWLYRAIPENDLKKIRAILDKDLSVDFLYKEDELYK